MQRQKTSTVSSTNNCTSNHAVMLQQAAGCEQLQCSAAAVHAPSMQMGLLRPVQLSAHLQQQARMQFARSTRQPLQQPPEARVCLLLLVCLPGSADERVSTDLKKQIIQARTAKKLTQAQLAQVRTQEDALYSILEAAAEDSIQWTCAGIRGWQRRMDRPCNQWTAGGGCQLPGCQTSVSPTSDMCAMDADMIAAVAALMNVQLVNEKPQIIQEYESGKAIPNPQVRSCCSIGSLCSQATLSTGVAKLPEAAVYTTPPHAYQHVHRRCSRSCQGRRKVVLMCRYVPCVHSPQPHCNTELTNLFVDIPPAGAVQAFTSTGRDPQKEPQQVSSRLLACGDSLSRATSQQAALLGLP